MTVLHILNGEEMLNVFKQNGYLEKGVKVPFNEAMCAGSTDEKIFSEEFIARRAKVHGVTKEQYREVTVKKLEPIFDPEIEALKLWFDEDMFCQINLLTLLAWLDQIGYDKKVELCLISRTFEPLTTCRLDVSGYHALYRMVLLNRERPAYVSVKSLLRGIELYLLYQSGENELVRYIRAHSEIPEEELVRRMIGRFQQFGLGDLQYRQLIREERRTGNFS